MTSISDGCSHFGRTILPSRVHETLQRSTSREEWQTARLRGWHFSVSVASIFRSTATTRREGMRRSPEARFAISVPPTGKRRCTCSPRRRVSLEHSTDDADPYDQAMQLFNRAAIAFARGDRPRAKALIGEVRTLLQHANLTLATDDARDVDDLERQLRQ
jgi:hypothetical protein